jgi:hypothetical protein
MPPYAHDVMIEIMQRVQEKLRESAQAEQPLSLYWLYMESAAVKPILDNFTYWLGPGRTVLSTGNMTQTE